jgi:hypothetical protein
MADSVDVPSFHLDQGKYITSHGRRQSNGGFSPRPPVPSLGLDWGPDQTLTRQVSSIIIQVVDGLPNMSTGRGTLVVPMGPTQGPTRSVEDPARALAANRDEPGVLVDRLGHGAEHR